MLRDIHNYKDWIQARAEDIVYNLFVEPFGKDFDEVWERHKDWAYHIAMEHYKDAYANSIEEVSDAKRSINS